jgi:hypothetical protein
MAAKGNRTDLNNKAAKVAKQTVPGQTYGKATEQMTSQSLVPMAPSPTDVAAQKPAQPGPMPGRLGAFGRPTERPDEPVTAGANFGAGPNALQVGMPIQAGSKESALAELRAIYQMFPDDTLGSMIDSYLREGL